MIKKPITLLVIVVIAVVNTIAQQNALDHSQIKIKPVLALQLWSTFTHGAEIYNTEREHFEKVENRLNFQLRRSRIGLKGSWGPRVRFNLIGAADLVGRDALAGTEAGVNNGASPFFRLWSAVFEFKASENSDWANITAGYFSPRIGRESITSAFRSPSMEKAWSQNYLRRHLVGTGPGRAMGINIGGRADLSRRLSFGYDAGVFNSAMSAFNGGSQGRKTAPLLTARAHVTIGDPEKKTYHDGYKVAYSGERQGITFGVGGAWQDKSDNWTKGGTLSVDLLANYGRWSLDGDWSWMQRTASISTSPTTNQTGYVRLTHSININSGQVLQPAITNSWLFGETDLFAQIHAQNASMPSGSEMITELAINWLFHENLKVSLAYTLRRADAGELGESFGPNNYFNQANIGIIKRGNWIGVGLIAVL